MISPETIERIDAVPIEGIVEHFGQLTLQRGKACCPFHEERTPSFHVRPHTNTWRCFGCGRGGGSAQFLMLQGRTWLEAMRAIADFAGIDLPPQAPLSAQQEARQQRRAALYAAVATVEALCAQALAEPQSEPARAALDYCRARFGDPRQEGSPAHDFGLGFWPADLDIRLQGAGVDPDTLALAGVMDAQTARHGGPLAGRLVFPIHDAAGRTVGFAGRSLAPSPRAKYLNTRASEIYQRSQLLYGLHAARQAARLRGLVYLVEGYADLLRLHRIGAAHAVAAMGTQLSAEQTDALVRLGVPVTIIPDSDPAGQAAASAWGWALFARGVHVEVAALPQPAGGAKADADSALADPQDLDALPREAFPLHAARAEWLPLPRADTQARAGFARRLRDALAQFDDTYTQLTARALDEMDEGSYWRETLRKSPPATSTPARTEAEGDFLKRYGFTVIDGQMHAPDRSGKRLARISNFTLEPLYYVRAADEEAHMRLARLTNTDGLSRVVTFRSGQDGLFSAMKFRARVGREGNFSYMGREEAFSGLLEYINQGCRDCQAIERLGWDEQHGFWVWANGIYAQGQFHPFGATGVVRIGQAHYHFDPLTCGGAGAAKFRHRPAAEPIELGDWIGWMHRVFGGPGIMAVLYTIATINRDAIARYGPLPILNATGPRGTGKSMLANAIMRLFFDGFTLPNLPSSTLASLTATLAAYAHVPIGLDEYSNAIGTPKIELLKSLYDGGGRLKMGDNGRAVASEVRCGVFMCGQHVAETDVALFSRLIYMDFQRTHYTRDDEEALRALQRLERQGLTHLVHRLVDLRPGFAQRFDQAYDAARPQMEAILRAQASDGVISRTVHIWTVLLATFRATEELIPWPFKGADIVGILQGQLASQRSEMHGSDDVHNFWSVFLYLTATGLLREDIDYRIESRTFVVTDNLSTRLTFDAPQRVLLVDMSTAIGRYCEHGARLHGDNILNPLTMRNYLRKSQGFLTSYQKSRLCINDGRGGVEMVDVGGIARPKRKIKCCYAFRIDELPVDLQHLSAEADGLSPIITDQDTHLPPLLGQEELYPFPYQD